MKNIEKTFREIIVSHPIYPTDAAPELAGMVEKFIEWFTDKDSIYAILYGKQTERFATKDKDYTIEELYQFWFENVYKK